jgi:hypothetical protein
MSPQLLLVLIVATLTATVAGLVSRRPIYFFPVYWLLGVVGILVGQVLGRAGGINFFNVGLLELGTGLIVNLMILIGFHYSLLWYTRRGSWAWIGGFERSRRASAQADGTVRKRVFAARRSGPHWGRKFKWENRMATSSAGRLFSGLILGAALGGGLALLASVRTSSTLEPEAMARTRSGPTPFEPANVLIQRARSVVDEFRAQVAQAVAEGQATAARTREELTATFEAAKRSPAGDTTKD